MVSSSKPTEGMKTRLRICTTLSLALMAWVRIVTVLWTPWN